MYSDGISVRNKSPNSPNRDGISVRNKSPNLPNRCDLYIYVGHGFILQFSVTCNLRWMYFGPEINSSGSFMRVYLYLWRFKYATAIIQCLMIEFTPTIVRLVTRICITIYKGYFTKERVIVYSGYMLYSSIVQLELTLVLDRSLMCRYKRIVRLLWLSSFYLHYPWQRIYWNRTALFFHCQIHWIHLSIYVCRIVTPV